MGETMLLRRENLKAQSESGRCQSLTAAIRLDGFNSHKTH